MKKLIQLIIRFIKWLFGRRAVVTLSKALPRSTSLKAAAAEGQYIIMADNLTENFKGKAMRDGEELFWKAIDPVSVKSPQNKSVLPAVVLDDPDIMEAFPALDALPQENENEIEFWQWDEEGNPY